MWDATYSNRATVMGLQEGCPPKQRQKISPWILKKGKKWREPCMKRKSTVSGQITLASNLFGRAGFLSPREQPYPYNVLSSTVYPMQFWRHSWSGLCCGISSLILARWIVQAGFCFPVTHLLTSLFVFLFFIHCHIPRVQYCSANFSHSIFFCIYFSAYNKTWEKKAITFNLKNTLKLMPLVFCSLPFASTTWRGEGWGWQLGHIPTLTTRCKG